VVDKLEGRELIPEVEIDAQLPLSAINSRFFSVLRQFAPFGPGNAPPLFRTDGIVDAGGSRVVGKNHLKLSVVHPEVSGGPFSAIAFQQGDHLNMILKGIPFNICYHVEENEWNGSVTLQLNIKDIKFGD
jgi:single-stranded-DNA-specific exonuclease